MIEDGAQTSTLKTRLLHVCLALIGIAVFDTLAIMLENRVGVPFKTTFRLACAVGCLTLIARMIADEPDAHWLRFAFCGALVSNLAMFFSPLAALPASKGDLLFFAAPDAAILFGARAFTYPVTDDHQRAVRQQLIMGFILALAVSALILSIMFVPDPAARHRERHANVTQPHR